MTNTILVIEDDEQILENTLEILRIYGFDAIGAGNGTGGLDAARQYHPDLILCDVMMPDLSGHEVLAILRHDQTIAAIPFIYMTAQGQRNQIRQGMELGADDYLTKPFSSEELITAVKTRLYRYAEIVEDQQQKLQDLSGSIIHMLPHELRTPLNHILGYTDLLLAADGNIPKEKMMNMLRVMQRGGQRLYHLIENFLLYAQLQTLEADSSKMAAIRQDRVRHPKEAIELQALACAEKAQRQSDLRLNLIDVEAIQFSSESLKKLISEMLDNAFKFSITGTEVSVNASIEGDIYLLEFVDHGRGMTPQELSNIGPFMQFKRTVYEQQGSGIGLILVRSLVALYKGLFTLQSTLSEGTAIRIGFNIIQDQSKES
jgi:two-component system, sensor histidine kinase and response regulator